VRPSAATLPDGGFAIFYPVARAGGASDVRVALFRPDGSVVLDLRVSANGQVPMGPVQLNVLHVPHRTPRQDVWLFAAVHHGATPHTNFGAREVANNPQDGINVALIEVRNTTAEGQPAARLVAAETLALSNDAARHPISMAYMGLNRGLHTLLVAAAPGDSKDSFLITRAFPTQAASLFLIQADEFGSMELVDSEEADSGCTGPSASDSWDESLVRVSPNQAVVRYRCPSAQQTRYRVVSVMSEGSSLSLSPAAQANAYTGGGEGGPQSHTEESQTSVLYYVHHEQAFYSWIAGQYPDEMSRGSLAAVLSGSAASPPNTLAALEGQQTTTSRSTLHEVAEQYRNGAPIAANAAPLGCGVAFVLSYDGKTEVRINPGGTDSLRSGSTCSAPAFDPPRGNVIGVASETNGGDQVDVLVDGWYFVPGTATSAPLSVEETWLGELGETVAFQRDAAYGLVCATSTAGKSCRYLRRNQLF